MSPRAASAAGLCDGARPELVPDLPVSGCETCEAPLCELPLHVGISAASGEFSHVNSHSVGVPTEDLVQSCGDPVAAGIPAASVDQYHISAADEQKLAFMAEALSADYNDVPEARVHPDVVAAIQWEAARSPDEIVRWRDRMLDRLDALAAQLHSNGAAAEWLEEADPATRRIIHSVNGPLLRNLLDWTHYPDMGVVDILLKGAPVLGTLPESGLYDAKEFPEPESTSALWHSSRAHNDELLAGLRRDANSAEIHRQVLADAALGRMTEPVRVEDVDLDAVRLSPRFAITQGTKPDGSPKIRIIDDLARGGVNEACQPVEQLKLDGADVLVCALRTYRRLCGVAPSLFKADVDSAYRRVPIQPGERWCVHAVYAHGPDVFVAGHLALPFGALGSVFGWDRVGACLAHLARHILMLPCLRYVDDYFGPGHPATIEHAKNAFARLVRMLLGPSALSEHKLSCGPALEILGLDVSMSARGISLQPSIKKAEKWSAAILAVLQSGTLTAGQASKLSGALAWAGQHSFERIGRAMLQPLYEQQRRRRSDLRPELRTALAWWLDILGERIHQVRPWAEPSAGVAHLFADARGAPARLAAVLLMDGGTLWTDAEPDDALRSACCERSDNQIMAWELLSIALGVRTFAPLLRNRRLIVWSDNVGAECAVRKGGAKAWDHSAIIHAMWLDFARVGCAPWFKRVPTDDNVADLPSREDYGLLRALGAAFVEPRLEGASLLAPDTFVARSLRGVL